MHINYNGKTIAVIREDDLDKIITELNNENPYPTGSNKNEAWALCLERLREKIA